jgi:hypothetical protein
LGGSNPFAHVLMMGGASMVALYLLRHIRADLEGAHAGRGIFGRAGDVALGLGMHAALGGAGKAALGGAKGLRGVLGRGGTTPWDAMDKRATAADPQQILGPAQEGFDPVPGETGSGSGGAEGGSAPSAPNSQPDDGGGAPAITPSDPSAQGLNPIAGAAPAGALRSPRQPQRQPRRGGGSQRSVAAAAQPALDLGEGAWASSPAPAVDPITDGGRHGASWEQGAPPTSSYVGHDADIPIPLAPPDDHDLSAPPPPDDPGPPAATVDPITRP